MLQQQAASAGAGPAAAGSAVGLILDGDDDDDGDIVDVPSPLDDGDEPTVGVKVPGQHGKLVDFLQAGQPQEEEKAAKKEEEKAAKQGGGIILNTSKRQSKRSQATASAVDVTKLRTGIQALCKHVNPLGKCLGFVQDDMESMQREYETWKLDYMTQQQGLSEEKAETDNSLKPLTKQLAEVETEIKDQKEAVRAMKAKIIRNDSTIEHLLSTVVGTTAN
jgi:TRAF3-interacting protein 1